MDTSKEVRDCNSCANHVQGRTIDDCPAKCWDCTKTRSLVHWEPKEPSGWDSFQAITSLPPIPKEPIKGLLQRRIDLTPKPLSSTQYAALHGTDNPMDTQVDGDHYKKLKIQPMEYSMANNLDACQHTVVKYVTRFRDKGGVKDIDKAIHALQMLKQFEYGS